MRFARITVAIVLLLALPACSAATLDRTWDTLYDFQGLNTWGWAAKAPESGPELPYDLIDRAVRSAVERELAARGLRAASTNPSFRVTYYVGSEEVAQIDAAYYGRGWGGYWAYGWYGPDGVNVSQYDDGALTIDILSPDPALGLLWRSVARGVIDTALTQPQLESVIRGAVREMLEKFPPEKS